MRNEKIKVIIWGVGSMGSGIAKMILKKKGVEIVGAIGRKTHVGENLHDVLDMGQNDIKPVVISNDPEKILKENAADVVLIATDSYVKDSYEKIVMCLEKGSNVISTAEEMAFPWEQEKELAGKLDFIAKENGVTVLGTGINPGFVLDTLILALTGTCGHVEHIKAARVNDLSPFGPAVMNEQGVGTTEHEFMEGIQNGKIAGHVGFPESIGMVAKGLGWNVEKIEQTREPIIAKMERKTRHIKVKSGDVAGCRQCGYGYVDGKIKIEMEHPQQVKPELEAIDTGDYIWIKGEPDISMSIKPEIPGGIGTIAMCVNMIPHVINARSGVKTMLDLPLPRAIMGDMRQFIEEWEENK